MLPNFQRDLFSHWVTLRSRWRDMDGLRHINHAAYLTYMETARLDFYHQLGFEYDRWDLDVSTILVGMEVNYYQQATHPTLFDIGTRLSRIGRSSFDLLTAVFRNDSEELFVGANFTLVTFNYAKQTKIDVPDSFRTLYDPLDLSSNSE
ncbi:MAG: acyl-CoA thioesterase [FCB group bacterium]|nr:acyl-CoA thioesterase [FCB group bacterium]